MMTGVNTQSTSPWMSGRNLTTSTQGLSYREVEALNKIKDAVGSSVKLNLGTTCEKTGLTITFKGFLGASACGTRGPFMVTHQILSEMAEDQDKFNKWMQWVQDSLHQQSGLENWLKNNKRIAQQEDAQNGVLQTRANNMCALDFWNVHRRVGRS